MTYTLGLFETGLILGFALLVAHLLALLFPSHCRSWLAAFPRSRVAGTILLGLAAAWSFALIATMDLGEFAGLRNLLLVAVVAGAGLTWYFVEEFLAVRALGMLALLAAELLLCAAFMKVPESRLLVVLLAYVWIAFGLIWVGLPYLLRDQIAWISAHPLRWSAAGAGGALYGIILLAATFLFYR